MTAHDSTIRIRSVSIKQIVTIAAITLAFGAFAGLAFLAGHARAAISPGGDCSENSVIECGCSAAGECISKIQEGGRPGIAEAYAHFGLPASEYDRFASSAVDGTAHPDGTVTLSNGEIVMTDAFSIGRTEFEYSSHVPIGGHDFYLSSHADVLQGESLPVLILLNDKGEAEFATIKSCGNPIIGKKIEKEQPPQEEKPPKEKPREEAPPQELPKAGAAGSVAGIFLSATGAGAAAHRILARRK